MPINLPSKSRISGALETLITVTTISYILLFYFYPDLSRQQNIYYMTVLPFTLIYGLLNIRRFPVHNKLLILNVVTIVYLSLAAFWGPNETFAESWKLAKRGLYVGSFLIALWVLFSCHGHRLRALLHWFIAAAALSALVSLGHYFYSSGLSLARMSPLLVPHPIAGATAYGLGLVAAVHLFCTETRRSLLWLYLLAMAPLLVVIIFTQSRGPVVALAAAFIALAFFPGVRRHRLAGLLAAILVTTGITVFTTPLQELFLARGYSFRNDIWIAILSNMDGYILTGHGWWMNDDVVTPTGVFAHAHSIYVGTLRHAGVIGCILLAAQIGTHLWISLRAREKTMSLFGVWLVFALVAFASDSFYIITRPEIVWLAYWLPVVALCHHGQARRHGQSHNITQASLPRTATE